MKTYRPWALAMVLALPVLVSAAEPASSPCVAPASASDDGIEMTDLIDKVAKRTGKQFIVDPRVRAMVSSTGIDLEKVDYARLLAILTIHQFAAYEVERRRESRARRECPAIADSGHHRSSGECARRRIRDGDVPGEEHVRGAVSARAASAHAAGRSPGGVPAEPTRCRYPITRRNARRIIDMVERLDKAAPAGQKCRRSRRPSKSDK